MGGGSVPGVVVWAGVICVCQSCEAEATWCSHVVWSLVVVMLLSELDWGRDRVEGMGSSLLP